MFLSSGHSLIKKTVSPVARATTFCLRQIANVPAKVSAVAVALALFVGLSPLASAQGPTLSTDVGVDIAAWVPVVAAAVGATILAVLAVYFLYMIIQHGMRFISTWGAKRA